MKGSSSCSLMASVFAASTAALASSSSAAAVDASFTPCCCEGLHSAKSGRQESAKSMSAGGDGKDKFSLRFDGLRFIETLVTAHR